MRWRLLSRYRVDVFPTALEKETLFFFLAATGGLLSRAVEAGQQNKGTQADKQGGAGRHAMNVTNERGPARSACLHRKSNMALAAVRKTRAHELATQSGMNTVGNCESQRLSVLG